MNTPLDPVSTPDTDADTTHTSITLTIPKTVCHKLTQGFDGTLEDAALAGLKLLHGLSMPAHTMLKELSLKTEMSAAKVLRTAIEGMYSKTFAAPTPRGRPIANQTRDLAIYHAIRGGSTHAQVARTFGLSLVRIGQILAAQRAALGVEVRTPKPAPADTTPEATSTTTADTTIAAEPAHTPTLTHTPEPEAPNWTPLMDDMVDGMLVKDAALLHRVDEALAQRAYDAYHAALEGIEKPSRMEKASASYAGLYVLNNPDVTPEVLTLKESRPLAMPGLTQRPPEDIPDTRSPAERDTIDPEFGF